MRLMWGFAAWAVRGHGLVGSAARGRGGRGSASPGFAARGFAALSAATLGLVAAVAATSAVLTSGAAPALATATNSSGITLASVIPSTAIPYGRVTFAVSCASARATRATLVGPTLGLTKSIRMRASSAGGDFTVAVTLPGNIRPGTYHPSIDCSDGTSTTARLLVPAFGGGTQPGAETSTWLTAGGLVLIGGGALICGMALRRRLSSPSDRSGQAEDTEHSVLSSRFDYSAHSSFRFLDRQRANDTDQQPHQ